MKHPLISIIIPVFNGESYINPIFNDVIQQDYDNLEIIFVNDGSNDGTAKVLESCQKKDKRVKIISTPNSGPANARNVGLDASTGDYISFIDCDDRISNCYISSMVDEICDSDICICKYQKRFNGNVYGPKKPKRKKIIKKRKFLKYYFSNDTHTMMIVPWCKIIKRELALQNRFVCGLKAEDEEWSLRLYLKSKKITFINKALYTYQVQNGSDSSAISNKRFLDFLEISYERTKLLKGVSSKYYAYAVYDYMNFLYTLLLKKETKTLILEANRKKDMCLFLSFIFYPIKSMKVAIKRIKYKVNN